MGQVPKPSVDPKVKARFMLAQAKRMERLAKPLGLRDIKIGSLADVNSLLVTCLQKQADKELEPFQAREFTNTLEALRKIHQPSDVERTIAELLKRVKDQDAAISDLRRDRKTRRGAPSTKGSRTRRSRAVDVEGASAEGAPIQLS